MSWTMFSAPSEKRAELEGALRDDLVSRQSQKLRDAGTMGGPTGQTYVLVEGTPDGVKKAEELLGKIGTKLPTADAETLYHRFKEEEDAASAGMGLFFTEG